MSKAILFSGHLPDLPGREIPRFPSGMRLYSQIIFREYLQQKKPSRIYISLAAGADLLFANEAISLDVELVVILPSSLAHFRQFSILPFDADGFYNKLLEKVISEAGRIIELPVEAEGVPDFDGCNQALLEMLKTENKNPEAVLFLSLSSIEVKGGTQSFAQKLQQEGIPLRNLYPDFSEADVRSRDFSALLPKTGVFEKLDEKAVFFQKKWKSSIRLSLLLFALVLVLSAFDSVDEDLFGQWAGLIKNLAIGAAILAAVLEISLNPRKRSGRKEWIVNRARAEKLKQRFWMFLFTFDVEAEDERYRKNKTLCEVKAELAFLKAGEQLEIYRQWRIQDQYRYFVRKEEILGKQLSRSRLWQRSLLIIGVLYGILRLIAGLASIHLAWLEEINLLACLAGIAVVLGNYQESINTEDLYFQYREMAQRLREWEERHTTCDSVLLLAEVVEDAENLLAAQNNEWSIRLG